MIWEFKKLWGRIGSGGPTGLQNRIVHTRGLVGSTPTLSRHRLRNSPFLKGSCLTEIFLTVPVRAKLKNAENAPHS